MWAEWRRVVVNKGGKRRFAESGGGRGRGDCKVGGFFFFFMGGNIMSTTGGKLV